MAADFDDRIFELFLGAIETFPADVRDEAKDWLVTSAAAHRFAHDLQEKGIVAWMADRKKGAKD
jgi:hypothetical protein